MTLSAQLDRATVLGMIADDPLLGALMNEVQRRADGDPGHDLGHLMRVALWTLRLGGDAVDPREAVCAALLHDIVNLPKNHPERHTASERSASVAAELLARHGLDDDAIARISDAIRDHSFSRASLPASDLGRALQDADRLEALGAIGIFRVISTGTRMGARYFHDEDPWALRRPLDDRSFSVDHFFTKLLTLPDTMLTAPGRAEASRRTRVMRQLLTQLASELGQQAPAQSMTPPTENASEGPKSIKSTDSTGT